MAKIKSFTDLQQSKKLAEILPLESADMYYWCADHYPKENWIIEVGTPDDNYECICAWSLAALLGVLPDSTDIVKDKVDTENEKYMCTVGVKYDIISTFGNNPVDACVAMVEKLHELKML